MKTFKRFSAILIAVFLMVSMMVIPASAANAVDATTYTITINNTDSSHQYEAYQIFSGTLYTSGGGNTGLPESIVLSDIDWGSGVSEAGQTALGDAPSVASGLGNPAGALAFAKNLVAKGYLDTAAATSTYANGKYTISGLPAGYYLVKNVKDSIGETAYHAYTDYILKVVKDVSVDPKAATPTLTKTVSSTENGNYGNAISSGIGRTVWFELNASMPSQIGTYSTYELIFEDTLPAGMTYVDGSAKVTATKDDSDESYKLADGYDVSYTGNKLTVTVANAVASIFALTGKAPLVDDNIVVRFAATLTKDVTVGGNGNKNTAVLKFSNDPNNTNSHGTTSEQSAWVYTYSLNLIKEDNNNSATKLQNAKFTLWRYESSSSEKKFYATAVTTDTGYRITGVTDDETLATEFVTDNNGQFLVEGIADGTYHMTETAPPAGYNSLDEDFGFHITVSLNAETGVASNFNADKAGSLSEVSVTEDAANFTAVITVKNRAGSQLPETGGIGTTIFYGIGGVLVLGALSLLIVRKRSTAK